MLLLKVDNVGTITSARQVANELIGSSSIINAPKTPKHLRHEITQPSRITPKDIVASTTHGKQSNHGPKVQLFKLSLITTRPQVPSCCTLPLQRLQETQKRHRATHGNPRKDVINSHPTQATKLSKTYRQAPATVLVGMRPIRKRTTSGSLYSYKE